MNNIKIFDLHSDLPTSNQSLKRSLKIQNFCKKSGFIAINAVYRGSRTLQECENLAKEFHSSGAFLSFEDCCFEEIINRDGASVEENISFLHGRLIKYSPLYLSLGWNYDNAFCGGCAGGGELTNSGKYFISLLNKSGHAVDCAHANQKSFYQIVEQAKRPICSHTAFQWIYPHKRNIDKEQVEAILKKGGIIGLIGVGHFLTGIKGSTKNFEQAFYLHLENYLNHFGANGLCIGSDFYGSNAPMCSDGDYTFTQRLQEKLINWGVGVNDREKILYKNALNFFSLAQE